MQAYLIWIMMGIFFLIAEMLSATFLLFFLGLGFLLTGALVWLGYLGDSLGLQALVCAVFSIAGIVILRKPLQAWIVNLAMSQPDMGKEVTVTESVPPGGPTRVSYQGTQWSAVNASEVALQPGDTAQIVGINGNTLQLERDTNSGK